MENIRNNKTQLQQHQRNKNVTTHEFVTGINRMCNYIMTEEFKMLERMTVASNYHSCRSFRCLSSIGLMLLPNDNGNNDKYKKSIWILLDG